MELVTSNVHSLGERASIRNGMELRDATASAIRDSGLFYKEIARKAGITATTIGRLADGTTRDPRVGTCVSILVVLNYRLLLVKD